MSDGSGYEWAKQRVECFPPEVRAAAVRDDGKENLGNSAWIQLERLWMKAGLPIALVWIYRDCLWRAGTTFGYPLVISRMAKDCGFPRFRFRSKFITPLIEAGLLIRVCAHTKGSAQVYAFPTFETAMALIDANFERRRLCPRLTSNLSSVER